MRSCSFVLMTVNRRRLSELAESCRRHLSIQLRVELNHTQRKNLESSDSLLWRQTETFEGKKCGRLDESYEFKLIGSMFFCCCFGIFHCILFFVFRSSLFVHLGHSESSLRTSGDLLLCPLLRNFPFPSFCLRPQIRLLFLSTCPFALLSVSMCRSFLCRCLALLGSR